MLLKSDKKKIKFSGQKNPQTCFIQLYFILPFKVQ